MLIIYNFSQVVTYWLGQCPFCENFIVYNFLNFKFIFICFMVVMLLLSCAFIMSLCSLAFILTLVLGNYLSHFLDIPILNFDFLCNLCYVHIQNPRPVFVFSFNVSCCCLDSTIICFWLLNIFHLTKLWF
jgi:hypothetical protein